MIIKLLLQLFGVAIVKLPKELLKAAYKQVKNTNTIKDMVSSEYKHAHTYAFLKKNFPNTNTKDIGLAIEIALRIED